MKKLCGICLLMAFLLSLGACGKSPEEQWQEQYELGAKYLSEGNYEEAVLAFTAAIEIDPKRADTYAGLASIYAEQSDWESLAEILQRGLAETGISDLNAALMALGGSLSPEEEPALKSLSVLADMELQEGTHTVANKLAQEFSGSEYYAFPGPVMKALEPVLEAGQAEDFDTACVLLEEESLWKILYAACYGSEFQTEAESLDDTSSLCVWTQWDGAVIQLSCIPVTSSERVLCYDYFLQYRPESGKGFAIDISPMGYAGERSCSWLSGEVSGYLFNGPFVRRSIGRDEVEITAEGTAVNELVDGEYCQRGWGADDQYYQFDMGSMQAPWTNESGEACCIKSVDTEHGYVTYGGEYNWAMEGREGFLLYLFETPWVL